MDWILEVWKEACRHVEIGEAVDRIAPLLAAQFPFGGIAVRRLDRPRARLETVAFAGAQGFHAPDRARSEFTPAELEDLVLWCRTGAPAAHDDARVQRFLGRLAPSGLEGPWFAAPLRVEREPAGVLLFAVTSRDQWTRRHLELLTALLEPFAAMLENDRRFHELQRLREAAEADNRALLSRLQRHDIAESVVGEEAGLADVMSRVEKVAQTDVPVLILGETGSGKEVIARAIHSRSRRATGPIVRINCGAIPPELVDSELFGHEKGSFTGAQATRKGWFERADGGTLFLDEIGELPLAAQVRLLRILQDGTFERVGGQQPLTVDVRIVTATHRQLEEMVAAGTFRQDLWYRVSVFPIHLPPLRARLEDIPALANHFAWRAGMRLAGIPLTPTHDDLAMLAAYPWPGNVRELASVIERAAILGDGRKLEIAASIGGGVPLAPQSSASPRTATAARAPTASTLDQAVVKHIEDALAATHGRIEGPYGAAARLKINPHTLRARMRKLGIDWRRFRSPSVEG